MTTALFFLAFFAFAGCVWADVSSRGKTDDRVNRVFGIACKFLFVAIVILMIMVT